MLYYIIKKYGIGTLLAILFFWMGYSSEHTFEGGMNYMVCLGILAWLGSLFYFMAHNPKRGIGMLSGIMSLLRIIWYVISLKPLRIWIRRLRYGIFTAKPYPYLALYGSIVDTHAMKGKFSYGLFQSKTPVARAVVWRLLSRGALRFHKGADGQLALALGEWKEVTSAGLDLDLERTVYQFMKLAAKADGTINPDDVRKVIGCYEKLKRGQSYGSTLFDAQYQFADMLNTNISLKAYTKKDIQNIYGMRRFLKKLPSSYEEATFDKGKLEIQRIWSEYMAYAYLFGIEGSTLKKLNTILPPDSNLWTPLQYLMTTSQPHRQVLAKMMSAVSAGVPEAEDAVAAKKGRFTFAWHVEEIYDITPN